MIKNILLFILTIIIGVIIGFGAGKAYLYVMKKPCGCDGEIKQVKEWSETPDFLKSANNLN